MATKWYTNGLNGVLAGSINLTSDNIKACLIDQADYTVDLDAHQYLSSITGAAIEATSANLTSKTFTVVSTSAVFDAADTSFAGFSGDPTEIVVLYKDTGSAATSPLLGYFDGSSVVLTPNGNSVACAWSASGILSIAR